MSHTAVCPSFPPPSVVSFSVLAPQLCKPGFVLKNGVCGSCSGSDSIISLTFAGTIVAVVGPVLIALYIAAHTKKGQAKWRHLLDSTFGPALNPQHKPPSKVVSHPYGASLRTKIKIVVSMCQVWWRRLAHPLRCLLSLLLLLCCCLHSARCGRTHLKLNLRLVCVGWWWYVAAHRSPYQPSTGAVLLTTLTTQSHSTALFPPPPAPPLSVCKSVIVSQLLSVIVHEYQIQFPEVVQRMASAFSWLNLSPLALVTFGCRLHFVDQFGKLLIITIVPIVVVLSCFVAHALVARSKTWELATVRRLQRRLIEVVLVIMFLTLPSVRLGAHPCTCTLAHTLCEAWL